MMKDECLICKAPLVYLESDEEMECVICHKKESSKTRCVNGHYVCNECHMTGFDITLYVNGLEAARMFFTAYGYFPG